MKVIGIIPARYGSSRFPGKPLARLGDRPVVVHTWRAAAGVLGKEYVWIATDDSRIAETAHAYKAPVIMTRNDHPSGTSRVAEAAARLNLQVDGVINIQGDEPFVAAGELEALLDCMRQGADIATLVEPMEHPVSGPDDPNRVKCVRAADGRALYFSRALIPYQREATGKPPARWRHLGLYAYRAEVLKALVQLTPDPLEAAEQLEQLRWLSHGYTIQTAAVPARHRISIDTPADLEAARRYLSSS